MPEYINVNIFRYDPDSDNAPYFKSYRIKAPEEVSVLVILDRTSNRCHFPINISKIWWLTLRSKI
jgi:succinate dehydrogenase/fumarate reductase-like Fe-S protein